MSILDAVPLLRDLPSGVTVALIATLPVVELRGAIPVGFAIGLSPWEAFVASVIGNLVPVPALVWLLDPVQRWLSEHSRLFDRFFRWLFARTRRKHTKTFERLRDLALIAFVGLPLPGTGAWTGAAAAFTFGVPKWRAFALITVGVLAAGIAVTLLVATGAAIARR